MVQQMQPVIALVLLVTIFGWCAVGFYGVVLVLPLVALWHNVATEQRGGFLWQTLRPALVAAVMYGIIFLGMVSFPRAVVGLVFIGFLLLIPISTSGLIGLISFAWMRGDRLVWQTIGLAGGYLASLAALVATVLLSDSSLLASPFAVVVGMGTSLALPLAFLVRASSLYRQGWQLAALAGVVIAPGIFVATALLFLVGTR
jgi:hypothetical protein